MQQSSPCPIIVVMGVSGCGKSSLGRILADRFRVPFIEGDDYHPPQNLAAMESGVALSDADRWPWLDAIGTVLSTTEGGSVVSCSALRASYRERLLSASGRSILFAFLNAERDVLLERLMQRTDHFMPASLLASQLDTLEAPDANEWSIELPASENLKQLAFRVERHLAAQS